MSALENLKVATPCPMKWSQMAGDDRKRHCGRCRLNVYNVSAMTTAEATHLLEQKSGELCVKFVRRSDGTVLTQDCRGGFSEQFWNRVGAAERTGSTLFFAGLPLLILGALLMLFADNIKAMFGMTAETGMAGTTTVVIKPGPGPAPSRGEPLNATPPGTRARSPEGSRQERLVEGPARSQGR